MWKTHLKVLVVLLLVGLSGYVGVKTLSGPEPAPMADVPEEVGGEPERPPTRQSSGSNANFSIISEDVVPGERRSLDVRLAEPVDEETLAAIARRLRAQDERSFQRTFIVYYLPGMEVDAGGWATSHFNPDLEVRVLGMHGGGEIGQLRAEYDENVVGAWENNQPGSASRYILLEEDGSFEFVRVFPDGSSDRFGVVECCGKRRFWDPQNRFGEYFLIRNGRLELHDEEGLVYAAHPVGD